MDFTQYWFMFPISIGVATSAMLSGIGGAALFTPIFVIIFPMLGDDYTLSVAAAIGTALFIETFGFSSGFVGYLRKKLIDFKSAVPFIALGVPVAIAGAVGAHLLDADLLRLGYALLTLVLSYVMVFHQIDMTKADVGPIDDKRELRKVIDRDGREYSFRKPRLGKTGSGITGVGALLTGLLSVGIGEVVMPQLTKRNRLPVPPAAAISVFTVIVVVASASFTHIATLINAGGLSAVPWHLVMWCVPGVIIGGQLGPWLQGRIAHDTMERAIGILFFIIALAMGWIAVHHLLGL